MSAINYLWEYFFNFIEVYLFYLFIKVKLNPNRKISHYSMKVFLYLAIRYISLCLMNNFQLSSLITISVSCTLEIFYAVLFFNNSIGSKIFWGFMFSVLCMVSEFIPFFILKFAFKHELSVILLEGSLRIPFVSIYLTLVGMFVFIFYFFSKKEIIFSMLQKVFCCIFFLVGIMTGHFILYTTWKYEEKAISINISSNLIIINLLFNLFFIVLVFYVYFLGVSTANNQRILETQKINEIEAMEYENLCKTTVALREVKHDINIHLETIKSFIDSNNLKDLKKFIDEYCCSFNHTQHFITTGNSAIDCILSAKLTSAQKVGIATDYSIVLVQEFSLDTFTLSSLLGNLWSNAIEGICRISDHTQRESAIIKFYIKPFQDMNVIHIENNYEEPLLYNKDGTIHSKKSGKEHGFGMKRIFEIVKSVDGIIQINTINSVFVVHILLPKKGDVNENQHHDS